jgi:hypothetical protein
MIDIIFVMDYSSGGLGDVIRCLLNLHEYSLQNKGNVRLFIDFKTYRKDLEPYFKYKTYIPDDIFYDTEKTIKISSKKDEILSCLTNSTTGNILLKITSNAYGLVSMKNYKKSLHDFRENILAPSGITLKYLKNHVYPNMKFKKYISFHIRFGDYIINSMTRHNTEKRLDSTPDTLIECVKTIYKYKEQYPEHTYVLHSDSEDFKRKMQQTLDFIYIFPSVISHTAEECKNGYLTTIAEFFFISEASCVVQLCSYSGFSHIASMYSGTNFISESHNDIIQSFQE